MHQCGPTGVKNTRSDCSSQRVAYQEEISSGNNLCGSLQFTIICLPAEINKCRRDLGSKDFVRTIRGKARSQGSSVSGGQRKVRGDNFHASDQGRRTNDNVLWSQRSLSKRSCGKEDQEPSRSSQNDADSCTTPMADCNRRALVAIRPTNCERNLQHCTNDDKARHEITAGIIQQVTGEAKSGSFPAIWMPSLRLGRQHASRKETPKVAAQVQDGNQLGHIQSTCQEHRVGVESHNRSCVTTIPCQV